MTLTFTVFGEAIPQGSSRAFMRPGMRHPVVTSDNPRLRGWRQLVAEAASAALEGVGQYDGTGAVAVVATFYLPRPKSLAAKVRHHLTNPDLDKLARAINDALTGVLWRDDSQVTDLHVRKVYAGVGQSPRAVIAVATGDDAPLVVEALPAPLFPELEVRHP